MRLTDPFTRVKKRRDYVVVSVGGSLIVPDGIDTDLLTSFRAFILDHVARGISFYIVAGGGQTARRYQRAVEAVRCGLHEEDVDWLGIHATRLNAQLLRAIFKEEAQARIVKNPTRGIHQHDSVIIGAGWRPGWSTDYCAVMAAKELGATRVVNLSNIDYAYTADPREDPTATPIKEISWPEFRALIPEAWDSGLSSPFDPVASKLAQSAGIEVAIINGAKLDEFGKYLNNEEFIGTKIR
jgi:uridylate kinase